MTLDLTAVSQMTSKAQATKENTDKSGFVKIKPFVHQRTLSRSEEPAQRMKEGTCKSHLIRV